MATTQRIDSLRYFVERASVLYSCTIIKTAFQNTGGETPGLIANLFTSNNIQKRLRVASNARFRGAVTARSRG